MPLIKLKLKKENKVFKIEGKVAGFWEYLDKIDVFVWEFNGRGYDNDNDNAEARGWLFRHVFRKDAKEGKVYRLMPTDDELYQATGWWYKESKLHNNKKTMYVSLI